MPIVRVDVMAGRDREQLRRLIARVSQAVAHELEIPIERVRVVVTEVPAELWGVGGRTARSGGHGSGRGGRGGAEGDQHAAEPEIED